MFTACLICFHPTRKVRFSTPRLIICQWCITELCNAEISPNQVLTTQKHFFDTKRRGEIEVEIRKLERLREGEPVFDQRQFSRLEEEALRSVRQSENLLIAVYRSIFDDTGRRVQVSALTKVLRDQMIAAHGDALARHTAHQKDIENKIALRFIDLENVSKQVEQDLEEYFVQVTQPIQTKSKIEKIIRAFVFGIVPFDKEKAERLEGEEYETVKREIRRQDHSRCNCCKRGPDRGELHVHHIIHLEKFGTNHTNNLVTLCHPCHNKQHPEYAVTRTYPIRRAPRQQRFVAVDIETTGLSNEDSIIEIAAALFIEGELIDVFNSLVYTKRELPLAVTRLTGITATMLSTAPKADVVFEGFKAFIGKHRLVFHNSSFDMRFINRYANYFESPIGNAVHDTLVIARKKLPELPNHKLATLVEHFGINAGRSHHAKDDSIATGFLYHHLSQIRT